MTVTHTVHACLSCLLALLVLSTQDASADIPRWGVLDQELTSDRDYAHPLGDVRVVVKFTSPSGQRHDRMAFWDGGRKWRVRFSPDEIGPWKWLGLCDDKSNRGLNNQVGQFQCVPADGDDALSQHGPIRVSQDRLFFEHADGEPYFFLSCTAWNGVLKSTEEEWERYLTARQEQRFTAIQFVSTQWRGGRETIDAPVFIDGEQLTINPEMFQRMDERVATINAHGMVACPVILWALGDDDPGNALTPENALKLAQYIVDRWGAYNVIWFLAGDCRFRDESIPRWRVLGRELFGDTDARHLVTLHPSGENWMAEKFVHQNWFDFIGYQSGHGDGERTLRWLVAGPVVDAWKHEPRRPIVNLEPNYEAHPAYQSKQEHTPQHVRRAAYWSLMVAPPAGLTYGHNTVWVWNDEHGPAEGHGNLQNVGPWTDGLRPEGALSMRHLRDFFESGPRTKLRPAQHLLARQPGEDDLNRFVTVASSDDHEWTVAYTPVGDTIELRFAEPVDGKLRWFDPRTGEWTEAETISGQNATLQPPSDADWVASIRTGE